MGNCDDARRRRHPRYNTHKFVSGTPGSHTANCQIRLYKSLCIRFRHYPYPSQRSRRSFYDSFVNYAVLCARSKANKSLHATLYEGYSVNRTGEERSRSFFFFFFSQTSKQTSELVRERFNSTLRFTLCACLIYLDLERVASYLTFLLKNALFPTLSPSASRLRVFPSKQDHPDEDVYETRSTAVLEYKIQICSPRDFR